MARITIAVESPDSSLIRNALEAEIASAPFTRSALTLREEDGTLTIVLESDNLAALRGTFNSVMNWLRVILVGMR